jgi:hypothetical protein
MHQVIKYPNFKKGCKERITGKKKSMTELTDSNKVILISHEWCLPKKEGGGRSGV